MPRPERAIVYTLLATLAAWNVLLVSARGPIAEAAPHAWLDDLGPAERLVLSGTGGAPDLVVRNRGGRLAWGDAPHDRAGSVAYVHIGTVLRQLMQADSLAEERSRLVAELEQEEAGYRAELDDISARLQAMDPETDEARETYEKGSEVYQRYMGWQKEAMDRRGQLDAQQMETAYRELVEAVQVVAERRDLDTVLRFIPTGEPFNAENPEQAMDAIRLRSALHYPKDLDITTEVLEELALDVE